MKDRHVKPKRSRKLIAPNTLKFNDGYPSAVPNSSRPRAVDSAWGETRRRDRFGRGPIKRQSKINWRRVHVGPRRPLTPAAHPADGD
ncbi:hypothetical protein GWI33_006854 [Rhynchophorus ferrugineus]|uniref:Uncharacterized protein n=1 Tax=Rhynchophorus ferrugineus TaxID=354439 RepID=A0A834IGZ7_RHYFE|nr:hypothetical protein GWI33_006854 [Rhynchophorus ferrugineus]